MMIQKGAYGFVPVSYTHLNNYRASNTSIYPAYKGCKVVKEINLDMSEIILDYIQKHKKIVVDEKQNYFIN